MPLKRHNRKTIYKAYSFDVVNDDVDWPNGKRLTRDLIVHPGITVMLPVIDKNHILMIRQFRYGPNKVLWELPAGTIASAETPLTCAKRELIEEVGYKAKTWKKITSCFPTPGFNTEEIHCFMAKDLTKTETALEDDEIIEPHILSIKKVKEMIVKKQIVDCKSLVPLFYYLYLGDQ
jgi:ADP-ribose pyrophosphatase